MNKYRAKKVCIDGYRFDSMAEAKVYGNLKMQEDNGYISDLEVHPKWEIVVSGVKIQTYKADFRFRKGDKWRVVDVKSPPTAKKLDFIRTCKLMKAVHGIDVEVVYG